MSLDIINSKALYGILNIMRNAQVKTVVLQVPDLFFIGMSSVCSDFSLQAASVTTGFKELTAEMLQVNGVYCVK